jgi:hypothetical protein
VSSLYVDFRLGWGETRIGRGRPVIITGHKKTVAQQGPHA